MEIERKWLLTKDQFYDLLLGYKAHKKAYSEQAYLNMSPEVRVRRERPALSSGLDLVFTYELTLKGEGDLSRGEVNVPICEKEYYELLRMANLTNADCIVKCIYDINIDNENVTICHVNPDLPSNFYYAEVEFTSEGKANSYIPPFEYLREVTREPAYKMKNIWNAQRLARSVERGL